MTLLEQLQAIAATDDPNWYLVAADLLEEWGGFDEVIEWWRHEWFSVELWRGYVLAASPFRFPNSPVHARWNEFIGEAS